MITKARQLMPNPSRRRRVAAAQGQIEPTQRQRVIGLLQDPILIVGTVISTATGVVLSVTYPDGEQLGIIVGLFLVILTMQLQLTLGERDRLDRQTLYGNIAAVLESDSWLRASALRILTNMRGVGIRFADSPVQSVCEMEFKKAAEKFDELSRGYIVLPYGDRSFPIKIVKDVERSMRAISVEKLPNAMFWHSQAGRRYFEAMRDALDRGVSIERVFIYSSWSDELEAVFAEQRSAGMTVHRVSSGRLDHELQITQHVWDDVAAYYTVTNANGDPTDNRFTIIEHEVKAIRERYAQVLAAALHEETTRTR